MLNFYDQKVDVTGIEPVTCCISDNRSKPTELYVIKSNPYPNAQAKDESFGVVPRLRVRVTVVAQPMGIYLSRAGGIRTPISSIKSRVC